MEKMSKDGFPKSKEEFAHVKSEIQVRELFYKYAKLLGWKVLKNQNRFPDYIIQGKSGALYTAEVEYDYANFVKHRHNPRRVDWAICWCDTLKTVPNEYYEKHKSRDALYLPPKIDLQVELLKLQKGVAPCK